MSRLFLKSLSIRRTVSAFLAAAFILTSLVLPTRGYASVLGLPAPGSMVSLSPAYVPVLIKGLKIHQDNPLAMDFIVDTGNSGLNLDQALDKQALSRESEKLIKYFMAALTLPEKDVWVNLSPYEKDRIIPAGLGQTEMGRDMLAQDYILKQITASMLYPEKGLGKDFWDRVYAQASQKFGTSQIPVNTFNKVWIMADRATVYENKDTAFVVDSHLKVMLEQDYLSLQKHQAIANNTNDIGSQLVRQIILPALEEEVNTGKNFANLRQIFHSLILAKWYKQAFKQALLNQVYSNKNKVAGVDVDDKTITQKIYAQYLQAYKKGVFNFIKEDVNQATQQPLSRKYFSGGIVADMTMTVTHDEAMTVSAEKTNGHWILVSDSLQPEEKDHHSYPAHLGLSREEEQARDLFGTLLLGQIGDTFIQKVRNLQEVETNFDQIGLTSASRIFELNRIYSRDSVIKIFEAYAPARSNDPGYMAWWDNHIRGMMEYYFPAVPGKPWLVQTNEERVKEGIQKEDGANAKVLEVVLQASRKSFRHTDLVHAFQVYVETVLHEYLDKTTPGTRAQRLEEIRAYLESPDAKFQTVLNQYLSAYYAKLGKEISSRDSAMTAVNEENLVFSSRTASNTPNVLESTNFKNLNEELQIFLNDKQEWVKLEDLDAKNPLASGVDIESLKNERKWQEADLNRAAMKRELGDIVIKHDVEFRVVNEKEELPFGYVCDFINHIVYVQPSLLKKFNKENGYYFKFFARKILAMSARQVELDDAGINDDDSPEVKDRKNDLLLGQQQLLTEADRRDLEVKYIEDTVLPFNSKLRQLYIDLFKDNAQPEQIKEHLRRNVLFRKDPTLNEEESIKKEFTLTPPEAVTYEHPSRDTVKLNREIYRLGIAAVNIMAVNAMDGIAEYRSRWVEKVREDIEGGEKGDVLRMFSTSSNKRKTKLQVMFSKFNPPTWAHSIITILLPFALSGSDVLMVSPSEFSNVKKEIDKTFTVREALIRADMKGLFGDLPFILTGDMFLSKGNELKLPFKGIENMKFWNGEEVLYMLCQQLKGDLQSVTYAAGEDYNFLAKPEGSVSIFAPMPPVMNPNNPNPEMIDYDLFWYLSDPQLYSALLNLQNTGVWGNYKRPFDVSGPNKKVLDFLLTGDVKPDWYTDLNSLHNFFNPTVFSVMPMILVPFKLMEIQRKFPGIKIIHALTMRQGQPILNDDVIPELVRTGLILPGQVPLKLNKMNIPGLLTAVSGTAIRTVGLTQLMLGKISSDGLGMISGNVAHVFRDHPEYIDKILRLDDGYNVPFPNNITLSDMSRVLGEKLAEKGLHDKITILAKTTHINLKNGGGDLEFNVQQRYLPDGDLLNLVILKRWKIVGDDTRRLIKDVLIDFLKEKSPGIITQIAKKTDFPKIKSFLDENDFLTKPENDKAMIMNNDAAVRGGIDFNTNKMQLNVQKQGSGVRMNFDAAMIRRFESGDFQGFLPVIINIRPINNIGLVLGLK